MLVETGSMAGVPPTYNPSMDSHEPEFDPEDAGETAYGELDPPEAVDLEPAEAVSEEWNRLRSAKGFLPGDPLSGELVPPASKSVAQRWILAALLAEGRTEISNLSDGADVQHALGVVQRCARSFERAEPRACRIEGHPPSAHAGPTPSGGAPLAVGESGTLSRLATAALALAGDPMTPITLRPEGTLLMRKSLPLFDALEGAGVCLVRQNLPGTWPVTLVPTRKPGELQLDKPISSQELSGLLLGLAAFDEPGCVHVSGKLPSAPYVALTLRALLDFGVEVHVDHPEPGQFRYHVRGPLRAPAEPLVIEPDASAAAVGLAAACISGGEVRVALREDTAQGDVGIIEHLREFGCRGTHEDGYLSAGGLPARGVDLDLDGEPDLAPPLAAVAAAVALTRGESSVLRGLGTLSGKESDRLQGLCDGLNQSGFRAECGSDVLHIKPGPHGVDPVLLDPHSDHRMAFAFALLSLLRPGIKVVEPQCVEKSWPRFWQDMVGLGARLTTL